MSTLLQVEKTLLSEGILVTSILFMNIIENNLAAAQILTLV